MFWLPNAKQNCDAESSCVTPIANPAWPRVLTRTRLYTFENTVIAAVAFPPAPSPLLLHPTFYVYEPFRMQRGLMLDIMYCAPLAAFGSCRGGRAVRKELLQKSVISARGSRPLRSM